MKTYVQKRGEGQPFRRGQEGVETWGCRTRAANSPGGGSSPGRIQSFRESGRETRGSHPERQSFTQGGGDRRTVGYLTWRDGMGLNGI